jgi:nicotinamidase-related amidase
MSEEASKTKRNAALLVMDMQRGLVEALSATGPVDRAARAVKAAREEQLLVLFVTTEFRSGHVDVHPWNTPIVGAAASGMFGEGTVSATLHPILQPRSGDVMVTKRRASSFYGTDLDVILRSSQVQRVVLAGITTGGVVLSTLREAADRDYQISVLSDACADGDAELHKSLLTKLFPQQADVIATDDWVKASSI